MKRKYQKTTGYWVYAHVTPDGMYYIGMSKLQPCKRWHPSYYKTSSLEVYITEYGWNNIEHIVLIDSLTKEQAEQWEDKLITALSINGLCINKKRSGGFKRDNIQAYNKQYNKQYNTDHQEELKQYNKKRLSTPEYKIYNRVHSYNQYHPDRKIETPAEAKQKYLEYGYIPTYIKNNDLK